MHKTENMLVKLGNWLFHYRNFFFPILYVTFFIPSPQIFPMLSYAVGAGSVLIASGILVRSITIGLVYIIRGGSKRQIYAETLVTEGIYSSCRNPMYLGNLLLLLGFGLLANSLLFILVFFPVFVFIYIAIIKAEEDFLFNKFGSQFADYKSRTNALLPHLKSIKNVFIGHSFNMKKVISKEHNSWFLYFLGLLMLIKYKNLIPTHVFWISAVVITILYSLIKLLKKNRILE